jgi:flagellar biosynthesis protein
MDMKHAVALKYNNIGAPKVVAKGEGEIAKRMITLANEEGIPIQQDYLLVASLLKVELDQEIPPEYYQVVAELLAFIYRLEQKNR